MIHQYRFKAALSFSSSARPSIALRYAMWMLAAGITPGYRHLSPLFYLRTRKYAEADESGSRTRYVNLRHAQTWILIGTYEYKMLMFPKSWLSIGKAVRLCQMLALHRLDGRGLGHRQALQAPSDVTEKEERRRTFWMAFGMDRYAAASTGWPVIIDERDVRYFRSISCFLCDKFDGLVTDCGRSSHSSPHPKALSKTAWKNQASSSKTPCNPSKPHSSPPSQV